jgi:hypothetical protein
VTHPAAPAPDSGTDAPGTRAAHGWVVALDIAMLFAFLALLDPGATTGFVLHEWLGLAVVPVFTVHDIISWDWIVSAWLRVRRSNIARVRLGFLLNTALLAMMLVIVVSGLVISNYAMPWARQPGVARWEQLHNMTSSLIIPVAGLHLGLNWSWIRGAMRRYVGGGRGGARRTET